MTSFLLIAVITATITGNCQCRNSYVIALPKVMSYGVYSVAITHLRPPLNGTAVRGEIKIGNVRDKQQTLVNRAYELPLAQCSVWPCPVSTIVDVQIGQTLTDRQYNVEVTGSSSEGDFSASAVVRLERKPLNIFIQTDKAVYKPSQIVNFRVLTTDADLKPVPTLLTVTIHTPGGNIIKQWKNQSEHAVFKEDLLLSDEPMTGDWKIKVKTENEETEKIFQVLEYVLPKFEVNVVLPDYVLTSTKEITVTVTAKYTYGKPVKGFCRLDVQKHMSWPATETQHITLQKTLVDGKVDFDVTLAKPDENLARGKELVFTAVCTEDLTTNAVTTNESLEVQDDVFKISFHDLTPSNFKPGSVYRAYVVLRRGDGFPPKPSDLVYTTSNGTEVKRQVELIISKPDSWMPYRYTSVKLASYTADIDTAGVAAFSVQTSTSWVESILILKALFNDGRRNVYAQKNIEPFFSLQDNYLEVRLLTTSTAIKVNDTALFNITSSFSLRQFNVVLLSRGRLVLSESITRSEQKEHVYELKMTKDLARRLSPECQLLVWTAAPGDELLADSISFDIDGAFSQVRISVTPQNGRYPSEVDGPVTARPGDPVQIQVKAEPLSYVGLLVVDYASVLLGSNDITQEEILSTLESHESVKYCSGEPYDPYPWFQVPYRSRRKRSVVFSPLYYFRSCPGRNTKEVIESTGLFIRTDLYLLTAYRTYPPPYPTTTMTPTFLPTILGMTTAVRPIPPRSSSFRPPTVDSPEAEPLAEVKRIRKYFPETWIFLDDQTDRHGMFSTVSTVPDSITSWLATAFAINSQTGLDVVDRPFQLKAFKPFFVTLDLPYSIIRNEEFELKIIVQNYLSTELKARVTLEKSDKYFQVSPPSNDTYLHARVWTDILVPENDGYSISIWIKPVVIGNIPIEVKVQSSQMADAVRKMLLVEPEGAPKEFTKNIFIRSNQSSHFEQNVIIGLPIDSLVPDSLRVYTSVVGDIMGPALSNLDSLLRMPYGCGEQNMLRFAPNIFIMDYLKATVQTNPTIIEKATKYTESGYQRELNYQRKDGCFSAFGNRDKEGSTWLTAFVLKSFWRGRSYLSQPVLPDIEKGMKCLLQKQDTSGQFREDGVIHHKAMQGGTSSGLTLTAYVTIALLEMKGIQFETITNEALTNALNAAQTYLIDNLSDEKIQNDPYSLAVMGYALSLARHSEAFNVLSRLATLAKVEGDYMYWEDASTTQNDKNNIRWYKAPTYKVELAAYALLMYVQLDKYLDAMSIMNWLVDQRNANGGYRSTQDTVMALQALTAVAVKIYGSAERSMNLSVAHGDQIWYFPEPLTQNNRLLLQIIQLDVPEQNEIKLSLTADGIGTALVQVVVKYNIYTTAEDSLIDINISTLDENDGFVEVTFCVSYNGEGDSGMVVIETKPLSGYEFVGLNELVSTVNGLKRTEQNEKGAAVYLDKVQKSGICVPFNQQRNHFVANLMSSRTVAYTYYDTDQRDSVFYLPSNLSGLNMCSTCPSCCLGQGQPLLHFETDITSGVDRTVTVRLALAAVMALLVLMNQG